MKAAKTIAPYLFVLACIVVVVPISRRLETRLPNARADTADALRVAK